MGQWFIDDAEYLRLWAWLARAPVEENDARCPAAGRVAGGNGRPRDWVSNGLCRARGGPGRRQADLTGPAHKSTHRSDDAPGTAASPRRSCPCLASTTCFAP